MSNTTKRKRWLRKFKSMDAEGFSRELNDGLSSLTDEDNVNSLLLNYNAIVSNCVEKFAPKRQCAQSNRKRNPWFNEEILHARRLRRQAERKWLKSYSDEDHDAFRASNRHVSDLIVRAKQKYFEEKLSKADTKTVFEVVNELLHKNVKVLPSYDDPATLGNRFGRFFVNKISKIRESLNIHVLPIGENNDIHVCTNASIVNVESNLSEFKMLKDEDIRRILVKMSNASCSLDAQPTWLLKENINCNVPLLTKIVNSSLQSGVFPDIARQAIVTPIIKKQGLDSENLQNYRPVSNLSHVAKVIEKAAAYQLIEHLNNNDLNDPLQSAYRSDFSTETALLKLQNDVIMYFDQGKCVFLVLLDLSAAFDTIDHTMLINLLEPQYHMSGTTLKWMRSYLSGWSSRINISGEFSEPWTAQFGVPQGSVLGPILFTLYLAPVSHIMKKYNVNYIIYADDIQLYVPFDPRSADL